MISQIKSEQNVQIAKYMSSGIEKIVEADVSKTTEGTQF